MRLSQQTGALSEALTADAPHGPASPRPRLVRGRRLRGENSLRQMARARVSLLRALGTRSAWYFETSSDGTLLPPHPGSLRPTPTATASAGTTGRRRLGRRLRAGPEDDDGLGTETLAEAGPTGAPGRGEVDLRGLFRAPRPLRAEHRGLHRGRRDWPAAVLVLLPSSTGGASPKEPS